MIVGIFLRHIKTYKGINFIPLSDGEKFCGLVGNNGIGKSTVLEALDKIFLQNKDWNINLAHNKSQGDANIPYIVPIFLIEKAKIQFNEKELELINVIDKAIKKVSTQNLPPRFSGAKETVNHIKRIVESIDNIDEFFLVPLGITYSGKKTFSVFTNYFTEELKDFIEDINAPNNGEEIELDLAILDDIFLKVLDIYRYIYIPRELSAEEFSKLHNKQFEFLMGKSLHQTLNETISPDAVRRINEALDGIVNSIATDLKTYEYRTKSDVRQRKLQKDDINNLIIEAYFNIRSMHVKVKDNSSIAITKLSSGEKQKAILDIANNLLKKNSENNSEKYIIFGFDEPECSLHISACFDMFQDLYETTKYCSQVLFTTHWYGYIPSVLEGNTVILSRDQSDVHAFDFINISKYREDTKILKESSRNQLPISIQLKSINDLVQAIIYGSMSENPFCWLICEGSSEKIYLSHFLDELVQDKRLRILPVGGYSEVKKLYNHLSIAFEDFKNEMKGKVFLLCDTDDKLESDTSHIKQDSQHPKLKYRRLIVDDNTESVQLVEVNSTIAAKSTVLEDALNGSTFIKTLDFFKDDNPELNSIIYETNRVDVQGKAFYPSALSLKLSVAESKELKNFFKKYNNDMKVIFAKKYIDYIEDINEIPWINQIKEFFS
ncbi:AAA family ATPase [Acinetobacter baumannii]|uniref:AAA family ATPase n=1 Tax=Acinetobacter baumannii TaxID=470 RepID=UPI00075059D9|nr:AAA family ATPase [Acinetobacter baumannii]MBJ9415596.1 AAA family ATPase [Acinetobacter baumannii]MDN8293598.1 AAA family ATPase [Acinetobacter baumannii]